MSNSTSTLQHATVTAGATRTGTEWSVAEITRLRDLRAAGHSIADIALALNRTYYAVSTMLQLTGLATPRATKPVVRPAACTACHLVHRGEC